MFAVYAEAATEVRRLLDRQSRQRLLDRPHCAALFCLFRSLDENAVEFLNTYAAAIDAETGEAVMMIIFFDDVNVLGESAEHKRLNISSTIPPAPELPVLQCEGVLEGQWRCLKRPRKPHYVMYVTAATALLLVAALSNIVDVLKARPLARGCRRG